MKRSLHRFFLPSLRQLLVTAIVLGWPLVAAAAESAYCKYNIHAQQQTRRSGEVVYKASYANYTNPGAGHLIVPAGSKITILKKSRKGFDFKTADGKTIMFEYHEPRMQMSIDQYLKKITSKSAVSLGDLSAKDRKGVELGKALEGMTREGVMTALGYPAAHKTPALKGNAWTYGQDRFRTLVVEFKGDKVVNIRQ